MCLMESEARPSRCGGGMWRPVFGSMSSLPSHLLRYRVTCMRNASPFPPPSHSYLAVVSPFFFLLFAFFQSSAVALRRMQICACGKYRGRVTFHLAVPSANRAAVGGERLAFFSLSKESPLVKHPLLACTDIECTKISLFFSLLQTTVGLFQVRLTFFFFLHV